MKTHFIVGAGLLLTLGTTVAGTFMYGRGHADAALRSGQPEAGIASQPATPEMIAMWKATAASTDYLAPKVPI
jgi:hypothetical protein